MEKIGIIGLGRLGLCFALNLERAGFEIIGVDKDPELVKHIQDKTLTSMEPEVETLLKKSANIITSTNISVLNNIEHIFCFVATPSHQNGSFDHSQVLESIESIKSISNGKSIKFIICCTTMPGFCEQLQKDVAPYNITVVYNPEFIAQGSIIRDQLYPDQILIGSNSEDTTAFLINLYKKMVKSNPTYLTVSPTEAEISKLATNCFLTLKIAFANALGDACKTWNVSPHNVLNAIGSDSRIGNKYLQYGYGFGGPCFPRDNKALIHATEQIGIDFLYSKTTITANNNHFEFQLQQLLDQNLDEYYFETLSYKFNSDIVEESQQLKLALGLVAHHKKVVVNENCMSKSIIEKIYPNTFIFR